MDRNIIALKRLVPEFRDIANKWEERQKLEEELGIITSDTLTEQFIMEEVAVRVAKSLVKLSDKNVGDFIGR
jgi:hypothetical protein